MSLMSGCISVITNLTDQADVTVSKWQHFRSGGFIMEGVFFHNVGNREKHGGTSCESRGAASIIKHLDYLDHSSTFNSNIFVFSNTKEEPELLIVMSCPGPK